MSKRKDWVSIASQDWNYHRPLSQTEIAERGGVSKMAVSKSLNIAMRNYFLILVKEFPDLTVLEIVKNVAKVFKIYSKDEIHNFVLTLPGFVLSQIEKETGLKIEKNHSKKMYRKVNGGEIK